MTAIADLLASAVRGVALPDTLTTRRWGEVTAVNVGPPASVDVTVAGVALPAVRYLGGYAPTMGDQVAVEITLGGDPLVLGVLA